MNKETYWYAHYPVSLFYFVETVVKVAYLTFWPLLWFLSGL